MNRISVNSLTSELIVAESSLIKDESSSLLFQISYNRSYVSRCLNKVLVLKINKDIDHQWTSDRQAEWSVHTLNLKADWIINMDTCRLCKKQPFTLQTQQIWGHLLTSNLPSEAAEATWLVSERIVKVKGGQTVRLELKLIAMNRSQRQSVTQTTYIHTCPSWPK